MLGFRNRFSLVGTLVVAALLITLGASSAGAAPLEVRLDERIPPNIAPDSALSIDIRTALGEHDGSDHHIKIKSVGGRPDTVQITDPQGILVKEYWPGGYYGPLPECTRLPGDITVICNLRQFDQYQNTSVRFLLGDGNDTIDSIDPDPRDLKVSYFLAQLGAGDDRIALNAPSTRGWIAEFGESGNDTLVSSPVATDWLDGGSDSDLLAYSNHTDPVIVDLAAPERVGGLGAAGENDHLRNIESLSGSPSDDQLSGTAAPNTIEGGTGADRIDGRGDDDTIVPGLGNDTVFGGAGDDQIRSVDAQVDSVFCGDGIDITNADSIDELHDCELATSVSPLVSETRPEESPAEKDRAATFAKITKDGSEVRAPRKLHRRSRLASKRRRAKSLKTAKRKSKAKRSAGSRIKSSLAPSHG